MFEELAMLVRNTRRYSTETKIIYPTLGLSGEAGEVSNKVKKILRDDQGELSSDRRRALLEECADVLWYLEALAQDLDSSLSEVFLLLTLKLTSRSERGVIQGEGDNR